ncbi:tetratricopeptide repeat protein [Oribacterium sp. WCC10]|uniref:tetratricopeptide repeat protein n=1 Tax=Oribacterium sp. WCC10 TaxID=1855343 RepID=UPI0008E636E2|nr:hypothetical protein [Oribacterium sp. WCC10]SFG83225.1 Tetratricopeptide repeat-containing protein [Oribacterium sp. WCC10]
MDKYEFNIKAEQMRKMADQGDYKTAMQIADTIDWRRVRNANLLASVAEIYEFNKEYEEAKDILLLAFERAPVGKRFLYKLSEISVKSGNIQDAQEYYREFCEMNPDDSRQYLLRYMILKSKGASAEQLVSPLEEYTSVDVDEKWLYELAKLYSDAGYEEECIKTCDKVMLLFGLGQYVDKAMELKKKYCQLSEQQLDLVENRNKYEENTQIVSEEYNDINGNVENTSSANEDDRKDELNDNGNENLSKSDNEVDNSKKSDDTNTEIEEIKSKQTDIDEKVIIDDIHIKDETTEKRELNNYHMIIEAKSKEDGFKIAVDEIKYFHDKYGFSFKVAKTNSEKLNEKGFAAFQSKIEGKDLIIEEAGALRYEVVDEIAEYIDSLQDSSSVVLVDEVDRFDRMAEDRPMFIKKFDLVSDVDDEDLVEDVNIDFEEEKNIIESKNIDENNREKSINSLNESMDYTSSDIDDTNAFDEVVNSNIQDDKDELPSDYYKEMDIDDFATYAQEYAKQIDCVLPGKTVLALYERIEIMQEDGISLNKASAEELIEEAADKAENPGIGKKLTGVFHTKYDKDDRLILREDCFIG